jgi:hypothetical protein
MEVYVKTICKFRKANYLKRQPPLIFNQENAISLFSKAYGVIVDNNLPLNLLPKPIADLNNIIAVRIVNNRIYYYDKIVRVIKYSGHFNLYGTITKPMDMLPNGYITTSTIYVSINRYIPLLPHIKYLVIENLPRTSPVFLIAIELEYLCIINTQVNIITVKPINLLVINRNVDTSFICQLFQHVKHCAILGPDTTDRNAIAALSLSLAYNDIETIFTKYRHGYVKTVYRKKKIFICIAMMIHKLRAINRNRQPNIEYINYLFNG